MAGKSTKDGAKPPLKYTPELGAKVCDLIVDGYSIDRVAATPGMPSQSGLRQWRLKHPEFNAQYFAAKAVCEESLIERLATINQEAIDAAYHNPDAKRCNAIVAALHNQAQDVKWLISKLAPRYGDKLQAELSGPGGAPIEAAITVTFVKTQSGNGDHG